MHNKNRDSKRLLMHFAAFSTLILVTNAVAFFLGASIQPPELDERRYADYALNLHDYGIFGLSGSARDKRPAPGNANGPLYPAFMAAIMSIDPAFATSIRCELSRPHDLTSQTSTTEKCPQQYSSLLIAQLILVVIAISALWFATQLLFGCLRISWLASLLVYFSTKPDFFARNLLTENLVLVFFAVLLLSLVAALRSDRLAWWGIVGLALGGLTLTRPEYLYLTYAFLVLGLIKTVISWPEKRGNGSVYALIAFTIVVAPWMARNYLHFAQFAVTGGYADQTVAYRVSYNQMSAEEWKAAFIYWLPGHGETLAKKFLPPLSYAKLGTDPDSYLYKEGAEIFEAGLAAVDGDRNRLTVYLINTEVLEKPVAHFLSSIPLAWRGVLTGKYLAIFGLPSFVILLFFALKKRQISILVLSFPAIFMIAFYAAVSVSIPRYNIYLIYYYGIATSWLGINIWDFMIRNRPIKNHV
ncbi:MAG: glycosyltransferase family 39 protein [Gammaproteobacteria bacterium]